MISIAKILKCAYTVRNMTVTKKSVSAIIILVIAVIIGALWYWMHSKQNIIPNVPTGETTPLAQVTYTCRQGKTITAQYFEGTTTPPASPDMPPTPGGYVVLTLNDGSTMTLKQTISADGIRYANPEDTFVFWSKGNGALVLENNTEKSYIGCIAVAPEPTGSNVSQTYANSDMGFSLRFPSIVSSTSPNRDEGYAVDETYHYEALGPGKEIYGVKFTIPSKKAEGTNLGQDSYLSVEELPRVTGCSASLFLSSGTKAATLEENGTTYSVASSTDAGAGNRYVETVYALPGTNPCIAVRYFVHYSVFENYEPGTVKQFDLKALMDEFDAIRKTLTVVQ